MSWREKTLPEATVTAFPAAPARGRVADQVPAVPRALLRAPAVQAQGVQVRELPDERPPVAGAVRVALVQDLARDRAELRAVIFVDLV